MWCENSINTRKHTKESAFENRLPQNMRSVVSNLFLRYERQ